MNEQERQKYVRNCPYFGNPKTIDTRSTCDLEWHYRPICPSAECLCAEKLGYRRNQEGG